MTICNVQLVRLASAPRDDLQYQYVSLYSVFIKSAIAKRALLPALSPIIKQEKALEAKWENSVFALLTVPCARNISLADKEFPLDTTTSQQILMQNAYLQAAHLLQSARAQGLGGEYIFGYDARLIAGKFLRGLNYRPLLLLHLEGTDTEAQGNALQEEAVVDDRCVIV